jgi:alpha/beta superfamily hydrolase
VSGRARRRRFHIAVRGIGLSAQIGYTTELRPRFRAGKMADTFHHTFFINGPAGRLEAILWTSEQTPPARVALVCHPHPLFGGTMHNKVVFHAARTLHAHGFPVLRFNFRGAGISQGMQDGGIGEADDVRAAVDYLAGEFPGRPIILAGFSFGAWVGLRVGCEDQRVSEIIGLGIPVNSSDLSYLKSCAKPKLFLQGGNDQYGSAERAQSLVAKMPPPKRLVIISGADHLFAGHIPEMASALDAWLSEFVDPALPMSANDNAE